MNAVVLKLREELQAIEEQTLALIGVARFRRIADAHGRIVSSFELSDAQRALSTANVRRLKGWTDAAASLLRRRGVHSVQDFRANAEEFAHRVALAQTGNAVQLERHWREECCVEIAEYAAELMTVVSSLVDDRQAPGDPRESFDLSIVGDGAGYWQIESTVRGMQAIHRVPVPFARDVLEQFIQDHCGPRPAAVLSDLKPLEAFGRVLFDCVFSGPIGAAYDALRQSRACLTVRASGVEARVPWELLHDGSGFLGLSERMGLVRAVPGAPRAAVSMRTPLRVLLTFSNASTRPWLDSEQERRGIEDAFAPLVHFGAVELDIAPDGTTDTMRRILRAGVETGRPYDLWHFTGHGGVDGTEKTTVLSMTTGEGVERLTYGADLRELLREHRQLKLVVLNACEGGRTDMTGSDSLLAAAMDGGTPAVVAMQYMVADSAAIAFAAELYGALADGDSIDKAVASARRAVFFLPNYTDWVAPVVFVADGGAVRP